MGCCLCIPWVVQNTKHLFLIHAGSVNTVCVFSLLFGAEAFVLFLRRAQPVLRSSVLTVHDIDEVDVTLKLGMLRY
jgi:hypothetical protein